MWANDTGVLATDFATFGSTLLIGGLKRCYSMMDFDIVDYKFYFVNDPHICRANIDGSGKNIFAANVFPRDIAIDWIGRRLFWTTINQNDIQTINLDSSERRVFISTKTPVFIALDPIAG